VTSSLLVRVRFALVSLLFAHGALAQTGHASRQQKIEEAMPHFQRGVELYDENDFTNALIEFRRAYDLAQDFHVLYNVAQTCYQLQNYACALDSFEHYLSAGSGLPRDRRAYVEKEVAKLRARVAQVTVIVNVPNADVMVDDEKVGVSPIGHPITVSQGKRKLTASVEGRPPATKTIEVAGGDSTSVRLDIETPQERVVVERQTVIEPQPVAPVVPTRRPIPWIAWGVTGGLAAVWAVTGVVALVYSSDAQNKLDTYGVSASDISSAQNGAKTFALVSDIALGCTIVAGVVATVMTLLAKPVPIEKTGVYLGPAGVYGRF